MAKKTPARGAEAFEAHFERIYGDRWPTLRNALEAPTRPEHVLSELVKPYYLDEASVLAARALEVRPGDHVLDLCAAPGGKSLVLALALWGQGRLVSNDRSASRRQRLLKVLDDHLPPSCRSVVSVTGHDGTRWGLYEQGVYDRVLVDAPCSSERHLLQQPSLLQDWSAHRSQSLARQDVALLCAGLEALKPGGRLVYSTCSISPIENDEVIERFKKKRDGLWKFVARQEVFPDEGDGRGPLFWTVLEKNV